MRERKVENSKCNLGIERIIFQLRWNFPTVFSLLNSQLKNSVHQSNLMETSLKRNEGDGCVLIIE